MKHTCQWFFYIIIMNETFSKKVGHQKKKKIIYIKITNDIQPVKNQKTNYLNNFPKQLINSIANIQKIFLKKKFFDNFFKKILK